MCYPGTFLKGLRKTMKHVSKDNRSAGRDLNSGPPEYEAGVLTTTYGSLKYDDIDAFYRQNVFASYLVWITALEGEVFGSVP
jgi:hypothetical protein